MKRLLLATLVLLTWACNRSYEYNCNDSNIYPVFVHFQPADIDTFIVRKFAAASGFTNLLDTGKVVIGVSGGYYSTSNDSTTVALSGGKYGITTGFDWQVYIPATDSTIDITDINSEARHETCHAPDKVGCVCYNRIFSLKINGISRSLNAYNGNGTYFLYINK